MDNLYKRLLLKWLSLICCALGDLVSYDSGGVVTYFPDHSQNGSRILPAFFQKEYRETFLRGLRRPELEATIYLRLVSKSRMRGT
jgi:hypothetical protein